MKKSSKIFVWSYLEGHSKIKKKILDIVDKVFSSGNLILGKEVKKFEESFAKYTNCKFAVGVNSGTDALQISLMALGVSKGDEVITVSNTAVPTVSAIVSCGATPIFVDINENDFLIDTNKIEKKITNKTKVIIPVNLYGLSANYKVIKKISKKYNIKILEDCAQSSGSKYFGKMSGSLGDISAFSFYPTKNLGAYGDGGIVVTNNKSLYSKSLMLRKYGMKNLYYSEFHGINSRLDEVHAVILDFKLKSLNSDIKKRRYIAKKYANGIKNKKIILPKENLGSYHSYYVYVIRTQKRNKLLKYLRSKNIYCNISYPFPIHLMRGYKYFGYKKGDLKITEKISKQILSLPMYPELSEKKVKKVIRVLNEFN